MRGLQELQAAELDERHPARGELDLEQVAVVRRCASAPPGRAADARRRAAASTASTTARASAGASWQCTSRGRGPAAAVRAQRQWIPGSHHVGQVEQPLPGAEVPLERKHRDVGEGGRQLEQVRAVRAAEGVDACASSPTTVRPSSVGPQRAHDVHLDAVHVLVLVDQHVVPPPGDLPDRASGRRAGSARPRSRSSKSSSPRARLRATYSRNSASTWSMCGSTHGNSVATTVARRPAGVDRAGIDVDQDRRRWVAGSWPPRAFRARECRPSTPGGPGRWRPPRHRGRAPRPPPAVRTRRCGA